MKIRKRILSMMIAGILTALPLSASSGNKFSFSGCVRQSSGCLTMIGAPIKNAKVTIDDNLSCIIDVAGKRKANPDFLYSTTTDSTGWYHFDNLDTDSFTCDKEVQKVTVEADGYLMQSRDILPVRGSLLNFDLFRTTDSNTVTSVTVMVVSVDTTWACMEGAGCTPRLEIQPLRDYRIELPDRYLYWRNALIIDTTDAQGMATFPLSVVPFVDYRIVAQSLHDTGLHGETTVNISYCIADKVRITIPSKTTGIGRSRSISRDRGPDITWWRTPAGFRMNVILPPQLSKGEYRDAASLALFDVTGKEVGRSCIGGIDPDGNGRTFFLEVNGLSRGMYVARVNLGARIFSQKIMFQR